MRFVFLKSIALLGRYFALVPFALSLLIGFFWLNLLDTHFFWFLGLGLFVALFFLASFALVLGMVFSGTSPNSAHGVTREQAPELWQIAAEEFGARNANNMRLYVSEDLNASVSQTRRFLGFFGNSIELEIGIPLMRVMDLEAVRAVIQHEFAHVKNKDTNGGRNTAEFFGCFEFLFDYMPPGESITGTIIALLLSDVSALIEKELMRLSRIAELRADVEAAKAGSNLEIARSTYLLATATTFMEKEIHEPLKKETLESSSLPTSPYTRLLARADELQNQNKLAQLWKESLASKPEQDSSHPTYAESFGALAISPDTKFAKMTEPALPKLVSKDLQGEIDRELQTSWESSMEHLYQY